MTEPIIIQTITTLGVVVVGILQAIAHRRTKALSDDVRVVRGQTENEHKDARFPNLRDEVTELLNQVMEIKRGMERADARTDRYIKDVDADVRRDRETMQRHIEYSDAVVNEARREFAEFKAACPARILHYVSENTD